MVVGAPGSKDTAHPPRIRVIPRLILCGYHVGHLTGFQCYGEGISAGTPHGSELVPRLTRFKV